MPPITVSEKFVSQRTRKRSSKDNSHKRRYNVQWAADLDAAITAVGAVAPEDVAIDSELLELFDITASQTELADWFEVDCDYIPKKRALTRPIAPEPDTPASFEYVFDISAATQHITHGLAETRFPASAPDQKLAINVRDGRVDGTDIIQPRFTFSKTMEYAAERVTDTWIDTVGDIVGRTNNAIYSGQAIDSLLCLAVRGNRRTRETWSITTDFLKGEELVNETVAGIGSVNKKPHEYLWVLYEEEEDATNNIVVANAIAVYVNQVYKQGDFDDLTPPALP